MSFHVYDGRRVIYETLDDARSHAQAAIDECRKQATLYEWPEMVSEIAVYEAPDDCDEPWRDGALVLEARERVIEDEDHPLGRFSDFDLVEFRSKGDEPDNFELVVADCLPDDDHGDEEPGAMCRRALKKAEASVDLVRQVAIKMSGSDDRADFERSYPLEQKKALLGTAREIIELVRGSSVEGPLPELGLASKASADERSNNWKLNVAESYVGTLSPNGGPGGSPELVDAIPLSEYLAHLEGKRS